MHESSEQNGQNDLKPVAWQRSLAFSPVLGQQKKCFAAICSGPAPLQDPSFGGKTQPWTELPFFNRFRRDPGM